MRATTGAPRGRPEPLRSSFFVQRHETRRPHFDLYLELNGRLLGWMLPHAPSPDPAVRRFALRTPDRDLDYGRFEGVLPAGTPGAGVVLVWDFGTYEPLPPAGVPLEEWSRRGLLRLHLSGEKLRGIWELVRWRTLPGTPETWVLVKRADRHVADARSLELATFSALTGRTADRIAEEARTVAGPPAEPARLPA